MRKITLSGLQLPRKSENWSCIQAHLKDNAASLPPSFLLGLQEAQKELLLNDLKEALDQWDLTASCKRNEFFKAAEASRYSDLNLNYGKADAADAVKLLVPLEWADDWEQKQDQAFGVKPLGHSAPAGPYRCRFGLIKPGPPPSSPDAKEKESMTSVTEAQTASQQQQFEETKTAPISKAEHTRCRSSTCCKGQQLCEGRSRSSLQTSWRRPLSCSRTWG